MKNETKTERVSLVANAAPIVGLNAAGTAEVEIARVNASDAVEIGNGAAPIVFGGGNIDSAGTGNAHVKLHAAGSGDAELHAQTGCLSLETTSGPIEIGATNHSRTITFGTGGGAAQQLVTIGSPAGSSSLTLDAGTGAISLGTSNSARTVNLATGAADQLVTVGSDHGASSMTIHAGTGNLNVGAFAAARTVNIATGAASQTINIGTGAAAHTIAIGSTTTGTALTLNAGSTGLINCTARVNVKAAAGLYVTDAGGSNGVYINQQAGSTHTLGSIGTTTTLRVLPTLEMDDNITILTDKAFGIGALAKRFSGIVTQTATQKAHDAFSGSEHITTTSAVQTTNSTTTTLYTSPNLLDESATWVEVHVAGHDTGGTNRGYAVRRALITRDAGGGATVVGSVNDSYSNLPGAWGGGVPLTTVNIDTSANTFRVRVQGAGATINWTCTVRYQTVSQNT